MHDRCVRLLEYAAKINNVAVARRVFGVSRKTDYEWVKRAEQYGLSARLPKERRGPHQPNAMSSEEVSVILAEAITRATLGPRALLRHLRARVWTDQPPGWPRCCAATIWAPPGNGSRHWPR